MDIKKYLNRIGYRGNIEPTIKVLYDLQSAHLMAVPFENLDIHYGKLIELDKTYEKVVINRRGGFCYELNSLFFQLLKSIGFSVKLVSARVYAQENNFGPEFDHMAIIAEIENMKYLADVGFGEFALLPLEMKMDIKQTDPRGSFIIQPYDETYLLVSKEEAEPVAQYIFSETQREINDFEGMCHYHQTSPGSHFTQKRICSLPTGCGRITITGNMLRIKEDGKVSEFILHDEEEFNKALRQYFKISL